MLRLALFSFACAFAVSAQDAATRPTSRPASAPLETVAAGRAFDRAIAATVAGEEATCDLEGRGGDGRVRLSSTGEMDVDSEGSTRRTRLEGLGAARVLAFAAADVDGDGAPELWTLVDAPPRLRAFEADGSARSAADVPEARAFFVLDDGDGADDLALDDPLGPRFAAPLAPRFELRTGAPIARFQVTDWDRNGLTDFLVVGRGGDVKVLDLDGRTIFTGSFGAPLEAFTTYTADGDSVFLDVLAVAGGRLVALVADGTKRFDVPFEGKAGNFQTADVDGVDGPEIVATTTLNGAASLRTWRTDGTEHWRFDVGAPVRSFAVASLGDGRRRLIALQERASNLVAHDPRGGAAKTFDAGEEVRSFSTADVAGDRRLELVALTTSGKIVVFDGEGAILHTLVGTQGRLTGFRATDFDGDGAPELVAGYDDGAGIEVFGRDGVSRAVISSGVGKGSEGYFANFGAPTTPGVAFIREEPPEKGGRRTVVTIHGDPGRTPPARRVLAGGRPRTFAADVDADGRAELVVWTDSGTVSAVDASGRVRFSFRPTAPFESVRSVDLDRDGAPELMTQHPDGSVRAYVPRPRDRRFASHDRLRDALRAVAAGDEAAAASRFAEAGRAWTLLEPEDVQVDREALEGAASHSAAAGAYAATL